MSTSRLDYISWLIDQNRLEEAKVEIAKLGDPIEELQFKQELQLKLEDPEQSLALNLKGLDLAREKGDKGSQLLFLTNIISRYRQLRNLQESEKWITLAENLIHDFSSEEEDNLVIEIAEYSIRKAWRFTSSDLPKMIDFALKGLNLLLAIELPRRKHQKTLSYAYLTLGSAYALHNEFANAEDAMQYAIALSQEIEDYSRLSTLYNNLGILKERMNDFSGAVASFLKSREIAGKIGETNPVVIHNLAWRFLLNGEPDVAMKYIVELQEWLETKSDLKVIKNWEVSIHTLLSQVLSFKAEFSEARKYAEKALEGGILIEARLLASLYQRFILICLEMDDIEAAEEVFKEFTEYTGTSDLYYAELQQRRYDVTRVHLMRRKNTVQDLLEAKAILQNILDTHNLNRTERIANLFLLADILLEELKIFKDEAILRNIENLCDESIQLATEHKSYHLLIRAQLTRSKLHLVTGEPKKSLNLLNESAEITQKHELHHLNIQIQDLIHDITQSFYRWSSIKSLADTLQSLQESELQDYIATALKLGETGI